MADHTEEEIFSATWLQQDAAYLYWWAGLNRDDGRNFMAKVVQENAAHSARLAREALGIEPARAARLVEIKATPEKKEI